MTFKEFIAGRTYHEDLTKVVEAVKGDSPLSGYVYPGGKWVSQNSDNDFDAGDETGVTAMGFEILQYAEQCLFYGSKGGAK